MYVVVPLAPRRQAADSGYQAVKEFSKARLRKRAQSNILRRGPRMFGRFPTRAGFGAPDAVNTDLSDHRAREAKDALYLIREEVAIMKKLNHPNLVQLIEVLDDPEEDTLYMVLEMCKKGVVMKVGLGQSATPYPEETCRHWFRDLILGIEYRESHVGPTVHSGETCSCRNPQCTRKESFIVTSSRTTSCSPRTTS